MATKTKTSEPTVSGVLPVEKSFTEALELLNAGKLAAAATAFTQVQAEAMSQERLNLARTARGYLAAIEARLHAQDAPGAEVAEMSAQLLLNQKNPQAALEALDNGIKALPERAALHYLKAVAYAQLGQVQESADALAKAAEFDADMLFQFRLEPDFDSIRHSGPFATLLRG
jgi:tetratricopeptide (TPR) repeat protein